ncbi:MAG: hypothetical protein M3Y39_12285 [Chloroflexota bacterium]|nr:hypothetical protein [Chloroflexota bacterium]
MGLASIRLLTTRLPGRMGLASIRLLTTRLPGRMDARPIPTICYYQDRMRQ